MKMVLTGMLIYLPNMVRSSTAIILCLFAIANLNFFRPQKNKVLFWLTQLSFLVTAIKYIATLMLSANIPREEIDAVGTTLIVLDISFMVSSVVAVFMAFWLLREKMIVLREKRRERQRAKGDVELKAFDYIDSLWFADDNDDEILDEIDLGGNQNYDEEDRAWRLRKQKTKTMPLQDVESAAGKRVGSGGGEKDTAPESISNDDSSSAASSDTGTSGIVENDGKDENAGNGDDSGNSGDARFVPRPMTAEEKAEHGEHVIVVEKLMNSYIEHENGLRRVNSQRQARQKRHTQMRVRARARIRSTNALRKVPMFQDLSEDKMALLIAEMNYEKFGPGAKLVAEGAPASKFYIITTGNCIVTMKQNGDDLDKDEEGKTNEARAAAATCAGPSLAGNLGLGFRDLQRLGPEEKDALWSDVEVGQLGALDFFGESALLGSTELQVRKATVRASFAAPVQVLSLSNVQFNKLVATGVFDASVVSTVKAAAARRAVVASTITAAPVGVEAAAAAADAVPLSDATLGGSDAATPLQREVDHLAAIRTAASTVAESAMSSSVAKAAERVATAAASAITRVEHEASREYNRKRLEALSAGEGAAGQWL